MASQSPQVSVVIPTRNDGAYLLESVQSALSQTLADLELIVVDDGSTDGATDELPADPRLRVIKQEHLGVSAARNRGVEDAKAPLVAFLDADDRWLPTKLDLQVAAMRANADAVLCYSAFAVINPSGIRISGPQGGTACTYLSLFKDNPIPVPTALVRTKTLVNLGGFDTTYSFGEDWDLWLRLAPEGPFCCVPECLAEIRIGRHNAGRASGSDPRLVYMQGISILGRHEIRARRAGEADVLAEIQRARRRSRRECSARAAALFVESLGTRKSPAWAMAATALRIDPLHGARTAAHQTVRRARYGWFPRRSNRRLPRGSMEDAT